MSEACVSFLDLETSKHISVQASTPFLTCNIWFFEIRYINVLGPYMRHGINISYYKYKGGSLVGAPWVDGPVEWLTQ
jgi:hypothetical protein